MSKITINKEFLFGLMHSHSQLAQAEYDRNPAYNDLHPSAIAEYNMINGLSTETLTEYFEFVRGKG